MRRAGDLFEQYWRMLLAGAIALTVLYFALFHGISHLAPAYSALELATQKSAASLQTIWHTPIDAPFKLLIWLPFSLGHHSVLWTRLAAAFVGTITVALFYMVLVHLFSRRVALLSTVLFIFSTGVLHASRLGSPLIMQVFGIVVLMASVPLYTKTRLKIMPLYLIIVTLALLFYTPVMAWFILAGGIVTGKRVVQMFSKLSVKHKILMPLLFAVLVTPLLLSIVRTPHLAFTVLGLPQTVPAFGANLFTFAKSLVWHGVGPAEIMLVGAPIINVIEVGLIAAGGVVMVRSITLKSNLFIAGGMLLLIVLIGLGETTYIPLVPFLFLLLASGIFYLLNEWFDVFPVNPVANVLGILAITLVVATSMLFHIRSYFVAWPHSSATHAVFRDAQPTDYSLEQAKSDNNIRF